MMRFAPKGNFSALFYSDGAVMEQCWYDDTMIRDAMVKVQRWQSDGTVMVPLHCRVVAFNERRGELLGFHEPT